MITSNPHSSHVTLEFRNEELRVRLSQLAIGFAIAAEDIEVEPCSGEIVMTIDGRESRMPVFLPNGIRGVGSEIALDSPDNAISNELRSS
jgi:hypothetical protein